MDARSTEALKKMTDAVVEAMKNGTAPWQMPWNQRTHVWPKNLATGKEYNGLNSMFLRAMGMGYGCNYWIGYGQAQKLGGHVKKGEKAYQILSPRFVKEKNDKGEERQKLIGFMVVSVFNVKQCEGLELPVVNEEQPELNPCLLDEFVANTGASVSHDGDAAYYVPSKDIVVLPPKVSFKSEGGYYGTLLHELAHWTGHESRLHRFKEKNLRGYAFEELVAELTAWLTSEHLGCPNEAENHKSYLASWIKSLENDPRFLMDAASQAEKASKFLMKAGESKALAA